jgi:hypothetical protein
MNRWVPLLAAVPCLATTVAAAEGPERLRRLAGEYYRWRNEQFPVASSDQGLHTWDDRLTNYSATALRSRRDHVLKLLDAVRTLSPDGWSRDDRIDRTLFLAQLEGADFFDRVRERPESDPQVYVSECSNAIFSLLKKDYDTPRRRALAATARLGAMPALLDEARRTLRKPQRLYARLAIDSARAMDSLFSARPSSGLETVRSWRSAISPAGSSPDSRRWTSSGRWARRSTTGC